MPELPEVETIRRGLADRILHHPITQVEIRLPKMIKTPAAEFADMLTGNTLEAIDRQGKLLIFSLQDTPDTLMLLHLKMTGQLIYRHGAEQVAGGHPWPPYNDELPNKYSHVIFTFATGARLYFNDQRQFGYIKLVDRAAVRALRETYGIEPLTPQFTRKAFHELFANRRTQLKAVLLNQKIISGIGNIYADEICFAAGVRPDRPVNTLTDQEIDALYDATQRIIELAIFHNGTTISDFATADGKQGNFSDHLQVYKRSGEACYRCAGIITKSRVAGRGTHWCPGCQK